jgi:hypothetical protein
MSAAVLYSSLNLDRYMGPLFGEVPVLDGKLYPYQKRCIVLGAPPEACYIEIPKAACSSWISGQPRTLSRRALAATSRCHT